MGTAKLRKIDFFANHPICCFCGGERESSTIGHVPCRSVFVGRIWPSGYEFPSCNPCNDRLRTIELVVASIVQLGDLNNERSAKTDTNKIIAGLRNNAPEFVPRLIRSNNEKRSFLRNLGANSTRGTDSLPMIELNPKIHGLLDAFLANLFCALFYLNYKSIFPKSGVISIRSFNNSSMLVNMATRDAFIEMMSNLPVHASTMRNQTPLVDQFFYRFGKTEDASLYAFSGHLRQSVYFVLIGFPERGETWRTWRLDTDAAERSVDIFGAEISPASDNSGPRA